VDGVDFQYVFEQAGAMDGRPTILRMAVLTCLAACGTGDSQPATSGGGSGGSGGASTVGAGGQVDSDASGRDSSGSGTTGGAGGAVDPGIDGALADRNSSDAATDGSALDGCAEYAAAYCAHQQACNAFTFGINYGTIATCTRRAAMTCPDELVASGSSKTAASLKTCTDALKRATCDEGVVKPLPACTFAGTQANGAVCRYHAQCQSAFCKIAGTEWCGVCSAKVSEGGSCGAQADCNADLFCTARLMCAKPIAEGLPCDPMAFDCAPHLSCSEGNVCEKRGELGQPCRSGGAQSCASTHNLLCVASGGMNICTAIKYAPYGAACDLTNVIYCAGSGSCRAADGGPTTSGMCLAPAADGQRCDPMMGIRCLAPAVCRNGTCEAPALASTCR
jgi:hypothetical protein